MKEPRTICANCKHAFTPSRENPFSKAPWYWQWCRAFHAQQAIDPVTGGVMWVDENGYEVCNEYAFCRDHNQGNCAHFGAIHGPTT